MRKIIIVILSMSAIWGCATRTMTTSAANGMVCTSTAHVSPFGATSEGVCRDANGKEISRTEMR
jgi:hypothetical protein